MPTYIVRLGPVKGEGGKVFGDGDRIELSPEIAQSMIDLKVIELVEGREKLSIDPEPSEVNPPIKGTIRKDKTAE